MNNFECNLRLDVALLAAQVLAGIGSNGINLGIGKRDLTEEEMRGFFSGLWNEALRPPLENTIQSLSSFNNI